MRIHPTHAVLCLLFSLLAPVQAAQPSQRVGPETAMAAYRELESWVRAWDVPESAPIDLSENATGVSVTLRLGGVIVGRGAHMRADAESLRDAAHMAWVEANQRINVERDALRRDRLLETAQRLRIELEIAGPLTPLFGDSEQDAAGDVSPGRHGVAARRGPRVEGVFPGAMLASNTGPAQAMRSALASLGYPLEPLSDLRTAQGVIVYRFESSHLAQLAPDGAPIFFPAAGGLCSRARSPRRRCAPSASGWRRTSSRDGGRGTSRWG